MNSGRSLDKTTRSVELFLHELLPQESFKDEWQHLKDTPGRVAKAFFELTEGYYGDVEKVLERDFEESSELICVSNIDFVSLCSHHILPFYGVAHVGYLPGGRVVGLSKIARLVHIYAKRLQVQERLTRQIADTLFEKLDAKGVMVVIQAQHMCMTIRGVKSQNSLTTTSAIRGDIPKEEVLNLIFQGGRR